MPPNPTSPSSQAENPRPDYTKLVRFLLEPFLESSESLRIDCEQLNHNQRIWIRLALEGVDQGLVFGRGRRNLQAIQTVLNAAAVAANQSVHLDIYGNHENAPNRDGGEGNKPSSKKRPSRPRPTPSQ